MEVRISYPELALDLLEFVRERPFFAVRRGSTAIDVVSAEGVGEETDRAAVVALVDEWAESHPGVEVSVGE